MILQHTNDTETCQPTESDDTMEARLPDGAGTLRTVCHPAMLNGKPQPYPDDAPAACKRGVCKCEWRGRWHENGRQPNRLFADRKAGEAVLLDAYNRRQRQEGRSSAPIGRVPLLEDYYVKWITSLDLTVGTVRNYRSLARNHAFPRIGKLPLDKISFATIKALIAYLESADSKTRKRALNPDSVGQVINAVLRAIFDMAIEEGWLHKNPCVGHIIKKPIKVKRYIPTSTEFHEIAHVIDPFFKAGIYLMAAAGLRQAEMLGFTVDCIQGDKLRIYRQWSRNTKNFAPLKHRKEGDERWIPLDPLLKAVLAEHMATYEITEGLLFPSRGDKSIAFWATGFDNRLNSATRDLGIYEKKITAHNFRHYFASNCVDRGIEIAEVSLMLGHANIQLTFDQYYQLPKDYTRIITAINSFTSAGIPEGVVLTGANAFMTEDNGIRVAELIAELRARTGMVVRLESPLALVA